VEPEGTPARVEYSIETGPFKLEGKTSVELGK
jgi:hypothetical protein